MTAPLLRTLELRQTLSQAKPGRRCWKTQVLVGGLAICLLLSLSVNAITVHLFRGETARTDLMARACKLAL